jgi:UDP-glucuronate decarboxylase
MKSRVINEIGVRVAQRLGESARLFEGKTILITGANGFLGQYFLETFIYLNQSVFKTPCEIVAADSHITNTTTNDTLGTLPYRFLLQDVSKLFPVEEKPDYILHAAGIASPMYYRRFPLETIDVATLGTRNMLELARKSKSQGLVYFSSSEIYGDPDPAHVPTTEDYNGNVSSIGPRACYDESKRLGETFCAVYHKQFGTRVMMVRPFNVYGPGMKEADYRVLPNFANSIKAGKALNIYGTGLQTRTFCFVEDAILGFLQVLLLGRSGEAYNIGNPSPEISMRGLVELITKISPRPVKCEFIPYPESYPAGEPMRRCPDITKAARDVGYAPGVDLEQGLRIFLDWTAHAYTGMDL